jgi:hypothetical protein
MKEHKTLTIDDNVERYFDFLVTDFGFTKVTPYGYSREIHFDYIKENLVVKICYDGGFFVSILKSKTTENDLLICKKRTIDYDFNFFKHYDLRQLDIDKKIFNSGNVQMSKEKELKLNSELLRKNPDVLKGNINRLTLRYLIIKKIKNWL